MGRRWHCRDIVCAFADPADSSDNHQRICFTLALWNGKDHILKERLYGLNGSQGRITNSIMLTLGNHGEDVKELYYYLDSTPTHSYMKFLYKYPQATFPYEQLQEESRNRSREVAEFELLDTECFDEDRYWDVFVEVSQAPLSIADGSTPKMKKVPTPCRSESRRTIVVQIPPTYIFSLKCFSETPGLGQKICPPFRQSIKNPKGSSLPNTKPSVPRIYTARPVLPPLHRQKAEWCWSTVQVWSQNSSLLKMRLISR